MADRQLLLYLLREHESFYLYEQSCIRAAAQRLRTAFPDASFLYSIKCNPAGKVLDTLFSQGFGADAASAREVAMAQARGVAPEDILFSAPARTEADLRATYGRCVQVADSLREIRCIAQIASERGERARIGIRIDPDFTFTADHGVPGKFGIQESLLWEAASWLSQLPIDVVGIHVHVKSQELSAAVLTHYYENVSRLIGRVQERLGVTLRFADFGSGLGIPFAPGEGPLDIETLGACFQELSAACRSAWPGLRLFIETGRYVTGPAGTYVTTVLDKKTSRGKTFVLLHDTLNGFIRPAMSEMVRVLSPSPVPYEPLFTHVDATRFLPLTDRQEVETVTLAGNLCTAADIIARDVDLPRLEVGDGLAMTNAGCYAAVMTPMQFASLAPPAQLFLSEDGQVSPA